MSEPQVVVNGCVLTEAQAACVRVAIESMLKALDDGPFAEDHYGREMSDLYCRRLREVRDLWAAPSRMVDHFIPLWAVKWAMEMRLGQDLEEPPGSLLVSALSSPDPTVGLDEHSIEAIDAHCDVHQYAMPRRFSH